MRVLKYLILTGQIGIIFTGATRYLYQRANSLEAGSNPLDMHRFGNDITTKRGTSGEIHMRNLISWFARLQKIQKYAARQY